MAAEGNVLTDYYAPQNICTPFPAGSLTGRYASRTGPADSVILPNDDHRLPLSEMTIPADRGQSGAVLRRHPPAAFAQISASANAMAGLALLSARQRR